MRRLILAVALLVGSSLAAQAVCPSPLTGKDAGGTTQNFGVTVDAGGNCYGNVALVDGTAAANKAAIDGSGNLAVKFLAAQSVNPGTPASWSLGATGAGVPANANYIGINSGGNLTGWNGAVSQSGNWSTRTLGNAGAILDFAGQNAASPANSFLIGGQFNTSPTTISNGNASPLQLDSSGNLLVNVKVGGSGSGGGGGGGPIAFFQPTGAFATLTATNASASVALPNTGTPTVMRFQNTGTTAVSCTLGIGSATATANENIIQPSSFVDVLIGANTFGACIDQTGSASNLVVLSGGTTGDPAVVAALNGATPAGTNIIGGTVPSAGTTGGCTGQTPLFTAASNNATQYKNSQGTVCGWDFDNTTTSLFSIRFYDTASAPAAGAPCNSSANLIGAWVQQSNAVSGGQRNSYPVSLQFNAGLVVCITGANANNDNTNAVTGGNFNLRIK